MRPHFRAAALFAAFATLTGTVQAISKVTREGRYLYNADGSRFYIKGIAYQEQGAVVESDDNHFGEPSSFIDPLAAPDACARDLPFLQQLGVNAIRVYSVNSSLNHDACMTALSSAGIYTIIDLALPLNGSIDRIVPSWSTNILDQYINTIDAFSKYDNVLAFNVGNEVVVNNGTAVAPFVKAAARDVRAYLNSKSFSVLVGYAAINGPSNFRDPLANYLSCDLSGGNKDSTAIDIYGLNDYSWCGDSTFQNSYAGTFGDFAGYNAAAYLSEFGCVSSPPRLWTESGAIFSTDMSPVWSGGVAFSYFPAQSAAGQFGIVTISADGKTVTTSDDFDRLKTQYNQATGPNSPAKASAPAAAYPSCPTVNNTFVASTTLPPTPNEPACDCLLSTLSCRFTPASTNYTAVVGQLLDTACSLVGQKGGSCDDIGGNGQTGVYGRLSGCDPTIKLSYIMSQYYQLNNRQGEACSFAGNGTVNPLAPSSPAAADAAASSCTGGSNTGGGSGSSPGKDNGAVSLIGDNNALVGMTFVALFSIASAVWTLA
ncbi:glycoside hydrolase family 72 protein [Lyophyllum atratum]|nr:glycoside hydrolase family 72 protein [Lyophyllum atratum]